MTMERNRRGQIDMESPEVKEDIKSEDETSESGDSDEDEIPVDLAFFCETGSEDRNCQQKQDPLHSGPSSISPVVSRNTNSRQDLDNGTGVTFKNKLEFSLGMQKEVSLVVEECTQVLKCDPREYHPFYLTVHKWLEMGLKQGHISEEKKNLIWEKIDAFAVSEFEKDQDNPINTARKDKPQSEYLQNILAQKGRTPSKVYRGVQTVEREWKRVFANEDPSHQKHFRTNLHARLKYFQSAKSITSPKDCIHMNSLWSQLLSSKLVEAPTCSQNPHENQSRRLNNNAKETGFKDDKVLYNEPRRLKRRKRQIEQARIRRSKPSGSEEAILERLAKAAQQAKLRRERLLKQMSPEEKQALKVKTADETRKRREKKREIRAQEDKQAVKDKNGKGGREKRVKLDEEISPEEREAWRDKERDTTLGKDNLQNVHEEGPFVETEEENENLRQIKELENRLKLDEVSLEKKVEIRVKISELSNPRREELLKEKGLSPEMKQKMKESTLYSVKRRNKKLKQDPTKLAELYKIIYERQKKERETVIVEQTRKRLAKENERQRRVREKETEEERQIRLIGCKVYQARIKLRKEMEEEEDFTEEEFEKRLEEIVKQIKAQPIPPSKYKPRLRRLR